ncbi:hypothetical protein Tco_0656156 [Tanacetum coccineum]|uniref:Uncharacterized protein n=1 Tax=Tanacetum coccineum TaxID=301880 RepID=A0ABQ4X8D7_9ASTR
MDDLRSKFRPPFIAKFSSSVGRVGQAKSVGIKRLLEVTTAQLVLLVVKLRLTADTKVNAARLQMLEELLFNSEGNKVQEELWEKLSWNMEPTTVEEKSRTGE